MAAKETKAAKEEAAAAEAKPAPRKLHTTGKPAETEDKVEIIKMCGVRGERAYEGDEFNLSKKEARYLVNTKKAELIEAGGADGKSKGRSRKGMDTETAGGLVGGR